MTATKPQRVDFLNKPTDLEIALMGELGFSTRFIQTRTHFTPCQISYRLRKAGVKRIDYRDGLSATAKYVMALAAEPVGKTLKKKIHANQHREDSR